MRHTACFDMVVIIAVSLYGGTAWAGGAAAQTMRSFMGAGHLSDSLAPRRELLRLTPQQQHEWNRLAASSAPDAAFDHVFAAWKADGAYALRQAIDWAVQANDPDYLKQILFVAALSPESGNLQYGILTIEGFQFQMNGNRLAAWQEITSWTGYEPMPVPIEIPASILERFRTQT